MEDLTAEVDLTDPRLDPQRPGGVDLHDPEVRRLVEESLTSIPGVRAARLVPGYERVVDELHIVTAVDRSPKTVVRDVQSALLATHGVTTDHRVISVVRLDDEGLGDLDGGGRRVTIRRVVVTNQGLAARVHVTIGDGDDELEGEDEGPSSNAGRRRAVARATLAAIRPLLGEGRAVEVEGVEVAEVLGHEVAMCFVHFHTPHGELTNCGSAMVRGDESDAVARAVLDAVNRAIQEAH